jgi:hypothetical protein
MTPFSRDKFLLFNRGNVNQKLFWNAVASVARHRFALTSFELHYLDNGKAPSPLRSAGALQI